MAGLNFNDTIRKTPQKPLAKLSRSLTQLKLDVTGSEYSGISAYPFKYLPVMEVVPETGTTSIMVRGGKEGIVLPKGTLVSLLTNKTTIEYGIPDPSSSGTIPVFYDVNTGSLVYAPVDEAAYGYHESISALMVMANGGATSNVPFSSLDDDLDGWTKSTDTPLILSANIPSGMVITNVYQDIRGKYLNYNVQEEVYSTLIRGRFSIPCVDRSKVEFGTDADVVDTPASSPYTALWRKHGFVSFASAAEGQAGQYLRSDKYGKFVSQYGTTAGEKTVQTVGRLLFTDSRFPKDLTGSIQNYPGMTLPGVNTKGLPIDLYLFVKESLEALGGTPSAQDILDQVRSGAFGYARVQLDV